MTLFCSNKTIDFVNPLSANPTKWSNTLEQFVGKLPTNCLSVFDDFVKLALKGLRRITSTQNDDFHCLNCLHSFRRKNKLESHKKVCENKDFCGAVMSLKDSKILKFTQDHKTIKITATIYTNLEYLINKKINVKII